jgi:hypothetical protein
MLLFVCFFLCPTSIQSSNTLCVYGLDTHTRTHTHTQTHIHTHTRSHTLTHTHTTHTHTLTHTHTHSHTHFHSIQALQEEPIDKYFRSIFIEEFETEWKLLDSKFAPTTLGVHNYFSFSLHFFSKLLGSKFAPSLDVHNVLPTGAAAPIKPQCLQH